MCDACTAAYAAVVYIVVKTEANNEVYIRFLASKMRVVPLQDVTILRLELLSVVEIGQYIVVSSHISAITDSMVTLHGIKGTCKEWNHFVQNLVIEIHQKTPHVQWNHCPGVTNPADLPSRGMTIAELQMSPLEL